MRPLRIAAIVEGHGEVRALPILIRRIATAWDPSSVVEVKPVFRVPASALKKTGVLEAEVENVARKLGGFGGILVLLDCDWDDGCPKIDGPVWLKRARDARPDTPIGLVLAHQEFETWFVAAAESIRGRRGLGADLTPVPNPESIRDAKGWLSRQMPPNRPYSPATDQAALTHIFQLQEARRNSDSFDKCYREIVDLLNVVKSREPGG